MELALWRWSTAVQVTSLVIVTLFFSVLARSVRPQIRLSVGLAELLPGGRPEAALEAADEAMYRAKSAPDGRTA